MPVALDVTLVDADGSPATGNGMWQVIVRNSGAPVLDTGLVAYTGASLTTSLAVTGSWTHLKIVVQPDRYAPAAVELSPTGGVYRDDPLVTVQTLQAATAKLQVPLLRLREAVGVQPRASPTKGSTLPGPWLRSPAAPFSGRQAPVYRELLVTKWVLPHANVTSVTDSSPTTGAFDDPDKDAWDRFNTRNRPANPLDAGAAILLEYGEVGRSGLSGPRFLVGLWAPKRPSSSASPPQWRDVVAMIHPSTAKPEYPAVAYPFRDPYPYGVGENPNVPANDPDRLYQPYVNLPLRHFVNAWSPQTGGSEAVWVMPIMPNPVPQQPDSQEYGLPFRTRAGLARLIAELNLFLHRMRYGISNTALDSWWGSETGNTIPVSTSSEVKPPPVRNVAVAGFSAATTQVDKLLADEQLSNSRYPNEFWGRPGSKTTTDFVNAWLETWSLDLTTGGATVASATFEAHLNTWVTANSKRKFFMTGSGTTGHDNPDAHYPTFARLTPTKITAQSTSVSARHATLWRGPGAQWKCMFCTNAYLSATAATPGKWPGFPVAPSQDEAHAFMYLVSLGLVFSESLVGW